MRSRSAAMSAASCVERAEFLQRLGLQLLPAKHQILPLLLGVRDIADAVAQEHTVARCFQLDLDPVAARGRDSATG